MNLLQVLDLLGTLVFAFSGSLLAARRGLDVFGFVVLALAAGTAGGALRDVLIGATPPVAITDGRYAAVCGAAALVVFVFGMGLSFAAPAGAVIATGLRLAAMRISWQAPRRAPLDG